MTAWNRGASQETRAARPTDSHAANMISVIATSWRRVSRLNTEAASPMIGCISGEISIAPITTAEEFSRSPNVAINAEQAVSAATRRKYAPSSSGPSLNSESSILARSDSLSPADPPNPMSPPHQRDAAERPGVGTGRDASSIYLGEVRRKTVHAFLLPQLGPTRPVVPTACPTSVSRTRTPRKE